MLTAQVVNHAPVLRFIHANPATDAAAVAAATQRVPSNVRRDLPKLEKAGLISLEPLSLTQAGAEAIALLDGQATQANPVRNVPEGFTTLPHHLIQIGEFNPRKAFDAEALGELAADILDRGLKQNLLVRPTAPLADGSPCAVHELVAGERRWRAIGLLIDRGDLDADWPIPVKVEAMDDQAHALAALLENLQRVDLTPLEEASAFDQLVNMNGWSTAEVAAKVNKTQRFVQLRLQLLKLSPDQKALLDKGVMTVKEAQKALANRPEEIDLTPVERLVLAMLYVRSNPDPDKYASYWRKFACHGEAAAQPLIAGLIANRLAETEDPTTWEPRHGISTTLRGYQALQQRAGELLEASTEDTRRGAMMGIENAAYAADKARTDEAMSLTAFLDGPFINSPKVQRLVDEANERQLASEQSYQEQLAERAAAKARQEADQRSGLELLARIRVFETEAPGLSRDDFATAFNELLVKRGYVGPFRVGLWSNGHGQPSPALFDGQGNALAGAGPQFEAMRRLQAIALNHAIGQAEVYSGDDLEPEKGEPEQDADDGDPSEWEPDTEEEFLVIVNAHFQGRYGQSEAHAIDLTKRAYARVIEGGEAYGDDSSEWDRLAACLVADGWAEDWPDTLTSSVAAGGEQ